MTCEQQPFRQGLLQSLFATGTPMPLFQIHGRAPISSTNVFTCDVVKMADGSSYRYVRPDHVALLTILLNVSDKGRDEMVLLGLINGQSGSGSGSADNYRIKNQQV